MTRETKIGLLVGLAFIIVIGILLSDQFTRQNEVPQANITVVGTKVREGTGIFQSNNPPVQASTPNPTPDQPVPTREETVQHNHGGGVEEIAIGPGGNSAAQHAHTSLQARMTTRQDPPYRASNAGNNPPTNSGNNGGGNGAGAIKPQNAQDDNGAVVPIPDDNRIRAARDGGEELIPVGGSGHANEQYAADPTGDGTAHPPARTHGSPTAAQEVQAAPGDTLSRLAARYMGANSKANRDAIIQANPSLQKDPNKILADQTYVIPAAGNPVVEAADPASAAQRHVAASTPEYWYVVQPGDSLIRIASDQLGDPKAYIAIEELNKDALKGGEVVIPNMKLRLPAKPIASAR